jgi:GT2 family glycosyltransferase
VIHPIDEATEIIEHVSVVIVTWNHRDCIPSCIAALTSQVYPSMDITVVDNDSYDGSAEWILEQAPSIRLIRLNTNQGFSRAFNLGAQTSRGEFILSLNPDVCVRPGFVAVLVHTAKIDQQIGVVSPKLLRADNPNRLDSTGLFIDRQRFPYDRGQMEPNDGRYDADWEVFGACGAAALYRRSMLVDLAHEGYEYFDESFFAYYEDADLSWRARLRGWQCVYAPEAVADHVRGWGDTLRKHTIRENNGPRYALRNHYLMMVKNDTPREFLYDFLPILFREIQRLIYILLFRREVLAGIGDFFRLLPGALKKRRYIQSSRVVAPAEMRRWYTKRRKLDQ